MSDPIDRLNRLGGALEGAPMPLPASEIRARGDRIRRRRHAVIAGAGAAVVAAVAIPVIAFTVGGSDDDPDFTPSPSVSDPVPGAGLGAENLITEQDAIWHDAGTDWEENYTYPGDGQSTPNPCVQSSFAGLGAESVFQRDFQWKDREIGGTDPGPYLNEIIGEFPSPAEARAAYQEIQGWYDDCLPPDAETFDAGEFTPVALPVDGEGVHMLATYGPVIEALDPFGNDGWFLDTGLVVSGDRIALITALSHGQDYNFTRTPAEQMVPVAAERLVIGNGVAEEPSAEGDGVTQLPEDFPLTSGWPEDDGSDEYQLTPPSIDNESMVAAGELTACDLSASAGDPVDRLTARLGWGSEGYVREVQVFADDDQAEEYLDSLQDVYSGCPTEDQGGSPPTFTTEVGSGALGEDSWTITRASDGIGRTAIHALRVGNAVLVDLKSDEGVGDTVMDLATETRENLADVVAAMNELQGGASGTEDPGATGPTTEIPADFPLDLVVVGETPEPGPDAEISGPGLGVAGVNPQTLCGGVLNLPNAGGTTAPGEDLGYAVSTIERYDGRTLRAYPNAQEAVEQMRTLRSQVQGCDRDQDEGGQSDRLWQLFSSDTGYDSITFGYTYEVEDNVGAPAGQLYTVVRVGNAVLAVEWGGEYSAEFQAGLVSDQLAVVRAILPEMCIFTADGC